MIVRILTACFALNAAAAASAQIIEAPKQVFAGDPIAIRIRDLPPNQTIAVRAERQGKTTLRAVAQFRADHAGTVDLARDAPVSGDYAGRDPAGLFWSMHTVKQPGTAAAGAADDIELTVTQDDQVVARATVAVRAAPDGLTASPVDGFPGATLHCPPATRRLPVAILLGGSEGGAYFGNDMVGFLARQGYATLVLPYYAPEWVTDPALKGLPANFADIPVDQIRRVRDWIARRPELDARHIVLVGVSKGAEFTMIAASRYAWLRAVVGIVPSDVVWEGWGPDVHGDGLRSSFAWHGRPLPFVPYVGMRAAIEEMSRGKPVPLAPTMVAGLREHPDAIPAATIPVERFKGPMLVIGAGRDTIWPSSTMAQRIAARRQAAHRKTELMIFPAAGHNLSGSGWSPLRRMSPDEDVAATAHAQAVIRPRLARFLRDAAR